MTYSGSLLIGHSFDTNQTLWFGHTCLSSIYESEYGRLENKKNLFVIKQLVKTELCGSHTDLFFSEFTLVALGFANFPSPS